MAKPRSKRAPSPEVVAKRVRALRLRHGGASYSQVAEALGCATSTAHEYVMDALRDTQQEPADAVRQMELERLDTMHRALWPTVIARTHDESNAPIDGAPTPLEKARAIERCLEVQARRAKLLGLDAPVRRIVEIVQHDELERLADEMRREIESLEREGVVVGDPTEWADRG